MKTHWLSWSCVWALLLVTNPVAAQTLKASLQPRAGRLPAPQLEDRAPRAAGFPLLDCLNSLMRADTARAEQFCSSALAMNPREHDAYKLRGYAYLMDHRFERAGADFEAALRLKPADDGDRAGYAQSLSGQGRFGEAVVQYRKALALAPAKAPYWNGLCWARAGTGHHLAQALRECNLALALQPGAAGALNSRGLVHLRMKKFDRAVSDYTASLAAGPLQASARFGRGLAQLYLGRAAGGIADIVQARRRDPDIDQLYVLLGVLPRQCAQGAERAACPPGFPPRGRKASDPVHLFATLAQPDGAPVARHAAVLRSQKP